MYGLLQAVNLLPSFHQNFRVTGTFFNPAPYACYIFSCVPIAFSSICSNHKSKFVYYISIFILTCILLLIPFLYSRSAYTSLLFCISLILYKTHIRNWILSKQLSTTNKRILMIILVTLILMTVYLLIQIRPGSVYGRVLTWKINALIALDYPMWGTGTTYHKAVFAHYQADYFEHNSNSYFSYYAGYGEFAFNIFLNIVSSKGLVGLVLFIIPTYICINNGLKSSEVSMSLCAVSLLFIIVFGLFSYPLSIIPIQVLFFFFLAYCASSEKNKTIYVVYLPLRNFVFTVLVFLLFFYNTQKIVAERYNGYKIWKEATEERLFFNYNAAIDHYERILQIFQDDGSFLLHYGHTLQLANKCSKAIPTLNEAKKYTAHVSLYTSLGLCYREVGEYNKAEEQFLFASNLSPYQIYPLYLLTKLYFDNNETKKALHVGNKLLNMQIKVPSERVNDVRCKTKHLLKSLDKK